MEGASRTLYNPLSKMLRCFSPSNVAIMMPVVYFVHLCWATTTISEVYLAPVYTPPVETVPVDDNNTTVFLANLDPNVTEEELKQIFLQFGEIISVKIPATKGCGFVQFASRTSAEESIQRMQGNLIGQQVVQLSWGRNPAAKLDVAGIWGQSADATSQWSAHYAYGQGYDAYAYGATQDPSACAYGAYAGYLQYPQQAEGAQDMAAMLGVAPNMEHREEIYYPILCLRLMSTSKPFTCDFN